jgi:hypothetical protein
MGHDARGDAAGALRQCSRQVPTTEGASFAQRTGCPFVEAMVRVVLLVP